MSAIILFEEKHVRRAWDKASGKWYFAIVDVIAVLTDSANPQVYWRVMKNRLTDEGSETVTKCNALKMTAADGKQRLTDVADTEQLLRLIQSIPSPTFGNPVTGPISLGYAAHFGLGLFAPVLA
jgi:DNA-damage-inducible protein D